MIAQYPHIQLYLFLLLACILKQPHLQSPAIGVIGEVLPTSMQVHQINYL